MPLGCRTWNDVFGINGKIVLATPGVGLWSLLATIIRVSEYQSARNYTKLCLYSLYTAAWTTRSMVCLTAPFNRTRTRPKPYKWLCFSLKSMIITMIFDEKKNIYQTGTTYKSKGDPWTRWSENIWRQQKLRATIHWLSRVRGLLIGAVKFQAKL